MNNLLFKQWLISEMADYGFESRRANKPQGGTEVEKGEGLFDVINTSAIMEELTKLPALGPNNPNQKWENVIEWGDGPGAIQIECTTLGGLRIVVRRKVSDLQGEQTWICKDVRGLSDTEDEDKEISVAHDMYEYATALSGQMIDGPLREFEDFERLAWKLWAAVKRDHPSYAMFPIGLRKQNENYYKLVFEFKGGGQGLKPGIGKQFDLDLFWNEKRGLIRCWGSNIEDAKSQNKWDLVPCEWDEQFSPSQDHAEIIKCIINTFMQY